MARAQCIKHLPCKPEDPSAVPVIHIMVEENPPPELSPDLHVCAHIHNNDNNTYFKNMKHIKGSDLVSRSTEFLLLLMPKINLGYVWKKINFWRQASKIKREKLEILTFHQFAAIEIYL